MNEMDIQKFTQGIFFGARQVIEHKDELNSINVFPVSDGDTGSNLAFLMQSILDNVSNTQHSLKDLLSDISFASLLGARGNSGMIFAQYLVGITDVFANSDLSTKQFVFACNNSIEKVYDSLLDPKEGTILSVISAWSNQLLATFNQTESFDKALTDALYSAEQTLLNTQYQLPILKSNNVVDAGGKGFYYFISGLTNYYCYNAKDYKFDSYQKSEKKERHAIQSNHVTSNKPKYRYCSEFIIMDSIITDKEELKKLLSHQGESIVIIGNQHQIKIHIHTNNPKELLSFLSDYGRITYQKVDDMLLQYEVTKNIKSKIAIVTDSIADIPSDWLLKYQIHIIPMPIQGENITYLDKLTIDSRLIYEKHQDITKFSTSQPSIQVIDNLLSFLQGKYEHVVVITVSSRLSGTYQLVKQRIRAKNLPYKWIKVIDSRSNSVGQGVLVMKAIELVEQCLPFDQLISELEDCISRLFIYVAVGDLTPMLKSGRIPLSIGKLAKKFRIFPIVSLDSSGKGILKSISFSQKQSIKKISKKVNNLFKLNKVNSIAVAHVGSIENVVFLKKELHDNANHINYAIESSTSIAISAGKSSIAVAGILNKGEN